MSALELTETMEELARTDAERRAVNGARCACNGTSPVLGTRRGSIGHTYEAWWLRYAR